jgi:Glycosyltransferase 61
MNYSTLAGKEQHLTNPDRSADVDLELWRTVPSYTIEPSMMFAHPTYLSDVYRAAVEHIYLPKIDEPSLDVRVKVATGYTQARLANSLKQKIYCNLPKAIYNPEPLDYTNHFIFDTRYDLDHHIGHLIDNVLTPLLFARKVLSEHFNRDIQVCAVLRKNTSSLSRQVYAALGINIVCTDDQVYGDVVTVRADHPIANARQEIFDVEFKGYKPDTPERIFIPRRGSRSLVNNDEVEAFLTQKGFTTYYFEDLTPSEEWSIVRNAKVIVAVHGAACSNFIFNQSGLKSLDHPGSGVRLLEIFSPAFVLPGYRETAHFTNGKWCAVRGQITPEILKELDFSNKPRSTVKAPIKNPFRVNLETLQLALDYLEVN